MACENEHKHTEHMCYLLAKGETKLIEELSSNPTVKCGVCGAKANSPDNICTPVEVFDENLLT